MLPRQTELPRMVKRPGAFARAYWMPLLILLLGTTADLLTTWHNIRLYGPGVEAHLVQRMVFQLMGTQLGVPVAKLIQLGFVLLVAAWWRPWTPWILSVCGLLYVAAAISNHFLLL